MGRQKTYLTSEQQWDRTVAAASAPFPPTNPSGGPPDGLSNPEPGYPVPARDRPEGLSLVHARRNHRLFLKGDVLIRQYAANCVRQWVWGVSGRGYRLDTYWQPLFRPRAGRGPGRDGLGLEFLTDRVPLVWVRVPDRLVGLHPADPEVRAYVLGPLRAGGSAARG